MAIAQRFRNFFGIERRVQLLFKRVFLPRLYGRVFNLPDLITEQIDAARAFLRRAANRIPFGQKKFIFFDQRPDRTLQLIDSAAAEIIHKFDMRPAV
ncbi:hypothetical protein SDC9_165925 [bioreactor metagenome]|uniref:Uncharacterized protein n=1 Tax=bioreactor metagenome TaxID=1076179 RepID=A0A645FVT8_9ZZZZ